MEPRMPVQASPIDMAPSCRGETRIPAVLERTLYLPSEVGGSGAGSKRDMLWFVEEVGFVLMVWWLSGLAEAVELSEGGMQWFK